MKYSSSGPVRSDPEVRELPGVSFGDPRLACSSALEFLLERPRPTAGPSSCPRLKVVRGLPGTAMTDDRQALAADLLAHLEATEELPLPDRTHRWLGEAQAAAADAVGEDVPEPVVRKRAGQVVELLSHVEETGEPEVDEHVKAAREIAREIAEQE